MYDKYYIPQLLDEPFRIFLLTIDEFLIMIIPIISLGFILNQMILGFFIGMSAAFAVKKLKGEQGNAYVINLVYWYLPPIIKLRATPPSYMREFIG